MKRKYVLTPSEMRLIKFLRDNKIYTNTDYDFQKFLIDLPKNIILGNKNSRTMRYGGFIKSDGGDVKFISPSRLEISPEAFSETKLSIKGILSKIIASSIYSPNIVECIDFNDVIASGVELNDLFKYFPNLKHIKFINCFISDNTSLSYFEGKSIEMKYTSIPNMEIFNNCAANRIALNRTKIRNAPTKVATIKADILEFETNSIDYRHFLFMTKLPNLKRLEINQKVFNERDLLLINAAAFDLEEANLKITVNNMNALDKVNLMPFIEQKDRWFSRDPVKNELKKEYQNITDLNRLHLDESVNISLTKQPHIRNKLLKDFNEAKDSFYKYPNAKLFIDEYNLRRKIEEDHTKLKNEMMNEFFNYLHSLLGKIDVEAVKAIFTDKPDSYPNNLIKNYSESCIKKIKERCKKDNCMIFYNDLIHVFNIGEKVYLDNLCKEHEAISNKYVNLFTKSLDSSLQRYVYDISVSDLLVSAKTDLIEYIKLKKSDFLKNAHTMFSHQSNIQLYISIFDYPIYNDIPNISDLAKMMLKREALIPGNDYRWVYSVYTEVVVDKVRHYIEKYSNKRKRNFNLFEVLALLNPKASSIFILRDYESVNFYKNIRLNSEQVEKTLNLSSPAKLLSKEEFLKKVGFEYLEYDNGLFVIPQLKSLVKEKIEIFDHSSRNKKETIDWFLMNYIFGDPKIESSFSKMMSDYRFYFYDYKQIDESIELSKLNTKKEKLKEAFINHPELNEADYTLYLNKKYHPESNYSLKMAIRILRSNMKEILELTIDDYEKIREQLDYKLCPQSSILNEGNLNHTILYEEVIKYVTGKYPAYKERCIKNVQANPKYNVTTKIERLYMKKQYLDDIDELLRAKEPSSSKILIYKRNG